MYNLLPLLQFWQNAVDVYNLLLISGSRLGGVDVLQWTEVKASKMTVTGVDHSKQHYVTITAINEAGLYTANTYTVAYQP